MNDENITKFQFQSGQEARDKGRAGGVASGKVRREHKSLRLLARYILDETKKLADGREMTTGEAMLRKQVQKAMFEADTTAARFIAELSGDLVQQINMQTDAEKAEAIDKEWQSRYKDDAK